MQFNDYLSNYHFFAGIGGAGVVAMYRLANSNDENAHLNDNMKRSAQINSFMSDAIFNEIKHRAKNVCYFEDYLSVANVWKTV